MFVLCVISPDHWLIVLLILSDYWPAAPEPGPGVVLVDISVMPVTTTLLSDQPRHYYSLLHCLLSPDLAGAGRGRSERQDCDRPS